MDSRDDRPLLEVSWEVANKVGGIHTVVSTKAKLLCEQYKDYLCIGPLFAGKHPENVTEKPAPKHISQVIDRLRQHNIHCVYGIWNIPGSPQVILIDANNASLDWNSIKASYYTDFQVDTLDAGWDVLEPMRWATATGMFIDTYQQVMQKACIAQFHEWMAGFGGLYCRQHNPQVATVFTTHATVLGRSMSANTNEDIYSQFEHIDPAKKAQELGVTQKHSAERACAQYSDVFTTVSNITSLEAESLLGRKPDVILPNGIVSEEFHTPQDEIAAHRKSREKLRDFIYAYFFGNQQFDLDQTLIFFTNGRYEYHNKGLDVLTDALGILNTELKEQNEKKRIVVFYFIPGDAHGIKEEVLTSFSAFSNLQSYVQDHVEDLTRQIIRNSLQINALSCEQMLTDTARKDINSLAQELIHEHNPPLCTHHLPNEENDDIISSFRRNGLDNGEEDIIKVIRLPVYLNGKDGLLDLTMEQAAAGTHLGLFPSYYEPWGYTPLESAAYGTPAITTDLAGFGRFVQETNADQKGVLVLKRHKKSYEHIVEQLVDSMREFISLDHNQRADRRKQALEIASQTQWQMFIKQYLHAHNTAYECVNNR